MCDDNGDIEQPKGPKTDSHFNEQGDLVTDDGIDRPASLQQHFTPRVYATLADFFRQLQASLQITPSISRVLASEKRPILILLHKQQPTFALLIRNSNAICVSAVCVSYPSGDQYG